MKEFTIGGFAVATAGHDAGKCYVIFLLDGEYVYLVDGKIRTISRPKKKKMMHVALLSEFNQNLASKIKDKSVIDEEIKRAIKMVQVGNSSKEAYNVKNRCC